MQGIASSSQKKSKRKPKDKLVFDVQAFLDSAGVSRKRFIQYRSHRRFTLKVPRYDVIYIQEGGVKLSVVNEVGKGSSRAILGAPLDFIGEGWPSAGQEIRMGTATGKTPRPCWSCERDAAACSTRNIRFSRPLHGLHLSRKHSNRRKSLDIGRQVCPWVFLLDFFWLELAIPCITSLLDNKPIIIMIIGKL